jgi:hypothetical protein
LRPTVQASHAPICRPRLDMQVRSASRGRLIENGVDGEDRESARRRPVFEVGRTTDGWMRLGAHQFGKHV